MRRRMDIGMRIGGVWMWWWEWADSDASTRNDLPFSHFEDGFIEKLT